MDPESTVEGVFKYFQDMTLPPGRPKEVANELQSINGPVRALYDQAADFNAQPVDFQSALLELRRVES